MPVTFKVARVGTGTSTLTSSTSAPVFIEQHALDGSLLGTPLPLPTTVNGANKPFSLTGTAVTEGDLTRSADGRFLSITGYAVAPGASNVGISLASDVPRLVARIDASGAIDTSTLLGGAFSLGNPRGAASADGSSFWVGGSGATTAGTPPGGVWFVRLGGSGESQLITTGVHWVQVFGGQLFTSGNASTLLAEILDVGSGLPVSGPQTAVELPGMPAGSGPSPWGFAMFDRKAGVPGLDTLYVADDRSGPGSGVQKWTFDGTTWTLAFTMNLTPATRFHGLGGIVTGSTVTLMASTVDVGTGTQNRLVRFVDDDVSMPVGVVVATTPNNVIYRGVAPNPHQ